MNRLLLAFAAAILLGASASGQVQDETNSSAAGDPITPDEVKAPALDWQDDAWALGLPFTFEDPTSVRCGDRPECAAALQNATGA